MAVSLVSTGVQFPDSTIQTTAATSSSPPLTTNVRQAVTSSATTAINFSSGNTVDLTMAANITTMTFSGVAASGTAMMVQIVVKNDPNGTAYTIVWPTSVYWNTSGGFATIQTAPTLATGANGVTVIALLTTDGGTKWRGWVEATIPGGTNANLFTWGNPALGRLANGNTSTYFSSPIQIGALTNWQKLSNGGASCVAVKNDGTLWAWGASPYGTLGIGSGTFASPNQVGSATNWVKADRGPDPGNAGHTLVINSSGVMNGCGYNDFGQLGNGSNTRTSSLGNVFSSGTSGIFWSDVAALGRCSLAISTTGTLWSSGRNYNGVLGLGNTTATYSRPEQVGALTNWASLARTGDTNGTGARFTGAVKTDGTLWMWGRNNYGQLGLGNLTDYSSPKQVGSLTNWKQLTHSTVSTLCVKTDGTLWSWGNNTYGQLGLGNTTQYSSPKQIGSLSSWAFVRVGSGGHVLATKTDGTLWSWGTNAAGQLGLGNTTSYSSPKQVGALTNWATSEFAITAMQQTSAGLNGSTFNPA